MKITLCDDTHSDLVSLETILENYSKTNNFPIELEKYSDPLILVKNVKNNPQDYKIFFLDIVMGNYNGVDIAAIIKRYCTDAIIVFTTTSRDFAIDAFSVRAFDYLLKPLDKNKVFTCFELLLKSISLTPQATFQIKGKDHSIIAIDVKDVSYIESLNRRLVFHKKDGSFVETTSLRTKFLESIPFDYKIYNFVNCHASFVVNLNYIKSISDKSFVLKDNTNIPISKAMYQDVKKQYIKYLVGD